MKEPMVCLIKICTSFLPLNLYVWCCLQTKLFERLFFYQFIIENVALTAKRKLSWPGEEDCLWQNLNPHSDTEIRWDMLLHLFAWNKEVHPKYIMSLARDELSWSDAGSSVHVDNEHVGIKWKTTASCHKLTLGGALHLGSHLQLLSPESTFLLSKCSDKERGVLWVLAHNQVWAQH